MFTPAHRRLLATVVLMVLLLFQSSPATAQAETPGSPEAAPAAVPQFNIQPVGDYPEGFFTVTLDPGETAELTAMVGTTADSAPVTLRAFRTNAIHPVNGGFAAGAEDDKMTGAATWIEFPAQSLDMGAGDRREITFTISVPHGTGPRQYVAALVAQTDGPIPIPGMDTFNQVIRSALGITIIVPGPETHGFELGTPQFTAEGTPQLSIPVANTGNYLVRPEGELTITTPEGDTVATIPVAMKAVYGGYTAILQTTLPGQMAPGDYVISGRLIDATSKTSATIDDVTATLADRDAPPPQFGLGNATVSAVGDPVQYAEVAATVTNGGNPIATANVTLRVSHDGALLEEYPLARNQALPSGDTVVSQRYIPASGWAPGTYAFEIVISSTSLDTGTEVVLASTVLDTAIAIP